MPLARLMTYAPGHFHAALVQKEAYPGVDPVVHVYAPLGPDLLAHLGRVAGFNARAGRPTDWRLEVHAGPDPLGRLLRERPGNVVVISGRNKGKIDAILAAVEAGLHVLADKPWVIDPADLPKLGRALEAAAAGSVVAHDMMTERYEVTSALQRGVVQDAETFGAPEPGTADEPGVAMGSVHYLLKTVAGVANARPAWFFDVAQQGEGLADVGTHLVDLVPWLLFPGQALDVARDVRLLRARRWPTWLTREQFARVTGAPDFPEALAGAVSAGRLAYACNNALAYTLRGVHVGLDVRWDYESAEGGDTHFAAVRGTRSTVEVRQGPAENHRPEVYVVPRRPEDRGPVGAALRAKVARLQGAYPGVGVEDAGEEYRLAVPDRYRVGHEAHFAEVTRQFLAHLPRPADYPRYEHANMLAKYHVTTEGVRLAHAGG